LETLGFLRRVWIRSDRRNYYRTADHIGPALQQGVLGLINNKIRVLETELAYAEQHLGSAVGTDESSREFMRARVRRAKKLCDFASQILSSPLLKIFTRTLRGNAAAGFL
jgi:hypothetical protein